MRRLYTDYISKDGLDFCESLTEICGEMEQLETAMLCLHNLIGWCEVGFNNDIERQDCEKLNKAYKLLEEVHKSYEVNYE